MSPHLAGRLRLAALLLVALLVQTTLVPDVRIERVAPDLLLLLTVCAGLAGGPQQATIFGFCAGLGADMFLTDTPVGLSALTFCLIGFAVGTLRANALSESRLFTPLMAFVATAAGVVLFVALGELAGQSELIAGGRAWLVRVVVIESVGNAVLSLPVAWIYDRAARGTAGVESLGRGRPDRLVTS